MYYTYSHSSPKGEIFYIGKGSGDRAFSFGDRGIDWKRAIKHYKGVQIKILAHWDTEEEAYEHEKLLISCFDDLNCKLVNKTKGGKGVYGYTQLDEHKKLRSLKLTGYKHKLVTCPNCNKTGGEPTMKRWHFDKCTGGLKPYKARVTIDKKRIWLGSFFTQKEATEAEIKAYNDANKPFPKEFINRKGLKL